jgi:hypothetical protein
MSEQKNALFIAGRFFDYRSLRVRVPESVSNIAHISKIKQTEPAGKTGTIASHVACWKVEERRAKTNAAADHR